MPNVKNRKRRFSQSWQ